MIPRVTGRHATSSPTVYDKCMMSGQGVGWDKQKLVMYYYVILWCWFEQRKVLQQQ